MKSLLPLCLAAFASLALPVRWYEAAGGVPPLPVVALPFSAASWRVKAGVVRTLWLSRVSNWLPMACARRSRRSLAPG